MKVLFSTRYGSHLYGTSTPQSDIDYKEVVLPDMEHLLLGKTLRNKVIKTNHEVNKKNSSEDIDKEIVPIQIFANDFLSGQTYALELAFAVDYTEADQKIFDTRFLIVCHELRENFLTSNIAALMGYANNQATLYSMKGKRLNAAKEVYDLFKKFNPTNKIFDLETAFESEAKIVEQKYPEYFSLTEYECDNRGTKRKCIKFLGKTILPYSSSFGNNLNVIKSHIKKYGDRAESASVDNVDWKATSHALRVVHEGITLLETHTLKFPYENEYCNFLLDIKNGKYDYDTVSKLINSKIEILKNLADNSDLPKKSFALQQELDKWLFRWLKEFYNV